MSPRHVVIDAMLGLIVLTHPRLSTANERAPIAPLAAPTRNRTVASQPSRAQEPHDPEPTAPAQIVRIDEPRSPSPVVDSRPSIEAMLGIGSDQLNLGLGLRGGKTFDNRLYVGGLGIYHVGAHAQASGPYGNGSSSASAYYLGPEVGYAFNVAQFVVRPYLGVGIAGARATGMSGGVTVHSSATELGLWPGVTGQYQLANPAYFVGADFRVLYGPWGSSVGLFATGGMHFGS